MYLYAHMPIICSVEETLSEAVLERLKASTCKMHACIYVYMNLFTITFICVHMQIHN
jgi:hypothetical protein